MDILSFILSLCFLFGVLCIICYCIRCENKRQKFVDEHIDRLVCSIESIRDNLQRDV